MTLPVDDQNCGNCKFWMPMFEFLDENENAELGYCRRYPPQIDSTPQGNDTADVWRAGTQPATHEDEWCGEWVYDDSPPDAGSPPTGQTE